MSPCTTGNRQKSPRLTGTAPPIRLGRGCWRYLCFAGEGRLRHRHAEDQEVQAKCLTLICNAIIVWNTVYTQAVLDQLRAEGQLITTSDLERLSPIQHTHIRPYGRYQFNTITQPSQLRPLRQPPNSHRTSKQTISANRV